ncbi:MAG TPA: endonuclease III [Bacteroidales bacterium]|nr:endonuclease III [Bacteroidales bacterium]
MNDWGKALEPLFKEYGNRSHPLHYHNRYQLLVMVILAAQTTDNLVNKVAPEFFKAYPSIESLQSSQPEDLFPLLSSVRGFRKKAKWIIDIAHAVQTDEGIPATMAELSALTGVGRKSANVIIRESGGPAEGIMVDLHVVRVAPRLGIATSDKPVKIEKELMSALPREKWNDAGMVLSYHGREICRPKPECARCIVNSVCDYYRNLPRSSPLV